MNAARATPEAGLFTPRIDYEDGTQQTSCFRFPSPASELIRGAETGPITQLLKRYNTPLKMPPNPEKIGWASFACILLRNDMIRDVGNMDEGYFLYFEDVEYCWRATRRGWSIAYVPDARTLHYQGGSGPVTDLARRKDRLPAYYYASRTRILYQIHGRLGPITANLFWYIGRLVANMRALFWKKIPKTNVKEASDIWINTRNPLGPNYAPKGN
jgi:GT2 family glycosyltransferase